MPGYTRNFFNTEDDRYSGENDKQIQAARCHGRSVQAEGVTLTAFDRARRGANQV